MVPVLKDFCCGCSLKTGCIIIGGLEIVNGISFGGLGNRASPHRAAWISRTGEVAILIIILVIAVSLLISGIVLIIGTLKANSVLLKSWIVVRGLLLTCSMCSLVAAIIMALNNNHGMNAAAFLFVACLESVIVLYFMLVAFSYHKSLQDDNEAALGNARRLADSVRLNSIASETLSFA